MKNFLIVLFCHKNYLPLCMAFINIGFGSKLLIFDNLLLTFNNFGLIIWVSSILFYQLYDKENFYDGPNH